MTCGLGALMDNLHCHESGLECQRDGRCKHWLEMESEALNQGVRARSAKPDASGLYVCMRCGGECSGFLCDEAGYICGDCYLVNAEQQAGEPELKQQESIGIEPTNMTRKCLKCGDMTNWRIIGTDDFYCLDCMPSANAPDFTYWRDDEPEYASLDAVLNDAYDQAAHGKGKDRHATDNAFEDQLICQIQRMLVGHPFAGVAFQVIKKTIEAGRLHRQGRPEAAYAEVCGAINYAAAMGILIKETGGLDNGKRAQ